MVPRSVIAAMAFLLAEGAASPPTPSFGALVAGIGRPSAVAVDEGGAVYVAAPDVKRVFRIGTGGRMTTVAGGGAAAPLDPRRPPNGDDGSAEQSLLSNPVALALDAGGNLYVADAGDRLVRRIDVRTITITTILGTSPRPLFPPPLTASFPRPATADAPRAQDRHAEAAVPVKLQGLAIDTAGNLYLSDAATHTVFRVKPPGGALEAVAGSGLPGFTGDGGLALQARLSSPEGIALNRAGDLFIADRGNHCVRKVDGRTGVITTIAGDGFPGASGDGGKASSGQLNNPVAVAVDTDGNLFVGDLGNARVRRVDRKTSLLSSVAGLEGVACGAIAVAGDGALVVADSVNWTVLRRNRRGVVTTIAGNGSLGYTGDEGAATSAYLSAPSALARDAGGNLYVTEPWANRVRRIEAASGIISTFAGNGRRGFDGDGGPATKARFDGPQGIACDRDGRLVVADAGNHRVRRVARDGTITTIVGTGRDGLAEDGKPALEVDLGRPSAVAFDGDGSLFVLQGPYGLLHRIDTEGRLRTVVGSRTRVPLRDGQPAISGRIARISAFAVSSRGDIVFADEESMRIWRRDAQTGIASVFAGRSLSIAGGSPDDALGLTLGAVRSLAFDNTGSLYLADVQVGIRRIDPITRRVAKLVPGADRSLLPAGLLFVEPGTLYIADSSGYVWCLDPESRLLKVAGGGYGF
jgi:sugar lactone lactonase YvrE